MAEPTDRKSAIPHQMTLPSPHGTGPPSHRSIQTSDLDLVVPFSSDIRALPSNGVTLSQATLSSRRQRRRGERLTSRRRRRGPEEFQAINSHSGDHIPRRSSNGEIIGAAQLVSSVDHQPAASTLTTVASPYSASKHVPPRSSASPPAAAAAVGKVRVMRPPGGSRGNAGCVELQWWENFMAGASASLLSKAILQPFDTTRTILQASKKVRGNYNNLWECAVGIVSTKGFPALYTGLMVSIAVSAPSSAIFLTAYEQAKRAAETTINTLTGFHSHEETESRNIRGQISAEGRESPAAGSKGFRGSRRWDAEGWWSEEQRRRVRALLLPAAPALAAVAGNVVSSVVRVPPEVVKQRVQAGQFAGFLAAVTSMWRAEGIPGFYTGYSTMVARDIPYAAIQFTTFETLKRRRERILAARALQTEQEAGSAGLGGSMSSKASGELRGPEGSRLGSKPVAARQLSHGELLLSNMWIGAMAGAMATIFTSPLDVLKTRVMTQEVSAGQAYLGTRQMLAKVWAEEGIVAFGRGMTPRLLYKVPSSAVFLVCYEAVRRVLHTARHATARENIG